MYEIAVVIVLIAEIFILGAICGAWFLEKHVYTKGDDSDESRS